MTNLKPLSEKEVLEFLDNWGYRQGNMPVCNDDDFRKIAHAICSHFSKPQIKYPRKKVCSCPKLEDDGGKDLECWCGFREFNLAIDEIRFLNGGEK